MRRCQRHPQPQQHQHCHPQQVKGLRHTCAPDEVLAVRAAGLRSPGCPPAKRQTLERERQLVSRHKNQTDQDSSNSSSLTGLDEPPDTTILPGNSSAVQPK